MCLRDIDGLFVLGKNIIEEGVMVFIGREESWFLELRNGCRFIMEGFEKCIK